MAFIIRRGECAAEKHSGKGPAGLLLGCDIASAHQHLSGYMGKVQTIYLDPPFLTGKSFVVRRPVGKGGWTHGKPTLEQPAYADRWTDETELLSLFRQAAELSHALLRNDGSLFLHIDSRMHARARILLDEVFGQHGYVNDIIWTYKTGGRARNHFSRKHDVILFFRKSKRAYFNIDAVSMPREGRRDNHMRMGTDETGRAYRAIVSAGKEYRYYDDDLVPPSDVWDDIAHLQQRDPERTGYETQKPLALLERIVLCSTRPGDIVCDLFGGSGTTATAAARLGRGFMHVDESPASLTVARRRLLGHAMDIKGASDAGAPQIQVRRVPVLGMAAVAVDAYDDLAAGLALGGVEALEQISLGYLRGDVFHAHDSAARDRAAPVLRTQLEVPLLDGQLALMTVDALGRRLLHVLEDSDCE